MTWLHPFSLLMVASIVCGIAVFIWRPNHPSTWVNSPAPFKRAAFRVALFIASWLAPFSVYLVLLTGCLRFLELETAFLAWPAAPRLAALFIPSVLLQVVFFRSLLRSARALATSGSEP